MSREAIPHFKRSSAALLNDSKISILKSNYLGSVSPKKREEIQNSEVVKWLLLKYYCYLLMDTNLFRSMKKEKDFFLLFLFITVYVIY